VETRYFSCSLLTASFLQNHINFTLSCRTAPSLSSASRRVTGRGGAQVPPASTPQLQFSTLVGSLFPRCGADPAGPGWGCSPHRGTWGCFAMRCLSMIIFHPAACAKNPMKLGLLERGGLGEGRRVGGERPTCPTLPMGSEDTASKLAFNHLPPFAVSMQVGAAWLSLQDRFPGCRCLLSRFSPFSAAFLAVCSLHLPELSPLQGLLAIRRGGLGL